MGFWSRYRDRRAGTRYPAGGLAPLSPAEVRDALLAINAAGVPFLVRAALPEERADLVAEWSVPEVGLRLRTRMRLVPDSHEVHTLDERWDRSPETGAKRYGRGPATKVARRWSYERGPDGRRRRIETFRFDSRDMRNPLVETVLGAGWTWRGVLTKW
ncbi:hypothetical protein ABZY42_06280 [Streptomyces sp. NPDC006622]|uniref:hypothetical protein n=1 Tax=Streptomyces sp. NPDC006622 TaxID=3155459 RepID=UPI0033B11D7F